MKKTLAWILAACLMVTGALPAFAAEVQPEEIIQEIGSAEGIAAEAAEAVEAVEPAAEAAENTEEADSASEKAEDGLLGKKAEDPTPDYLTFTAKKDNSSVTFKYLTGTDVKYSKDGGKNWTDCKPIGESTVIRLSKEEAVSFKGKNVTTNTSNHFSMTGSISASGSVTSLTDENGGDPNVPLTANCYQSMFYGCSSLTKAPTLPATKLAAHCYNGMFSGCGSLETAPALPAENLATNCYVSMFRDCKSLTKAPELPAAELATGCYDSMFYNCSTLAAAPILPAATLAETCYAKMFYGCTSLETAPALPAETLVKNCYFEMFSGCSKLNRVSVKFTDWNATDNSTTGWLTNVAANGIFECPAVLVNKYSKDASHFPEGWEKLNEVTVTTWAGLQQAITDAGAPETKICLGNDLSPVGSTPGSDDNKPIEINKNGAKIILDLNGYTINRGLEERTQYNTGYVINLFKGELTIRDSSDGEPGKITGGKNTNSGGAIYVCPGAILKLESGTITGNEVNQGGGVYVSADGVFTMTGGTITGNKAGTYGGGVFVSAGGVFTMTGGEISENTNGGVVVNSEGTEPVVDGIFTMTGGKVTGNEDYGVDISGKMIVGGTAKVTGNIVTSGQTETKKNVYLEAGRKITIGTENNAPKDDMEIGVTTQNAPTVAFTSNGTEEDVKYFFADNDALDVQYNSTNKCLELAAKKSIADILPSDFPTSNTYGSIPENAWTSKEGGVIYRLLEEGGGNWKKLMCQGKTSGGDTVDLSKTVTLVSGDSEEYTYTDDISDVLSVKFLFHLDNGKLTYIDVSLIGEDEQFKNLVGTYTPPVAQTTIADILPADFPTYGEKVWKNENGKTAYKNQDTGNLNIGGLEFPTATKLTEVESGYSFEHESATYVFNMTGDVLTSIKVNGRSDADANGTYTPPAAPEPKITITSDKAEYKPGETIELTITVTGIDKIEVGTVKFTDGVETRNPQIKPDGTGKIYDKSKTAAGTYTYKAYIADKPDIKDEVTVTVKGSDPKPSSDDSSEPVFTGTWNNPVKNGAWKQDASGIWSYTTTQVFRNTWGYIVNPFAKEGQNKADWFFFDQYGHMLTGWQLIGGKWYYLNPTKDGTLGACLLGPGKTPDGYEIDASGAWTGK